MAYRELGEARILKRPSQQEFLKPVRRPVQQETTSQDWQSLGQATTQFLRHVKPTYVTAS